MNNAARAAWQAAKSFAVTMPTWTAFCVFMATGLCGTPARAQLSVSDSGTPTFNQAIAVPPGVAGMSPKIGLSYAGGGVNGPVGYGWSIQGISTITRCSAIKAIDGAKGSVTFTASDKVCLDGQRLIQTDASGSPVTQTSDSQGGSGLVREFRTEKDSYARIRAYGYANGDSTGASGPAYFKVWTKSGQIYEYGASLSADANTNAVSTPYQKTVAAVWAVSRISDTLGNFIDFKYEQRNVAWGSGGTASLPTPGHEWNLLEIQYGGNKVVFNYTDRPDNTVGTVQDRGEAWHQGNKNLSIRLLQSVTTYINSPNTAALGAATGAVPVKTTKISYGNGTVSGRSRVTSITECAGDANSTRCLPATTFNYANGGSEAYQANAAFSGSALATLPMTSVPSSASVGSTYGLITGDFNGDGRTDFIRWSDDATQNKLFTSNGDGSFSESATFNLKVAGQNLLKSDGCYFSLATDINRDGLSDLFVFSNSVNYSGSACPSPGPSYAYLAKQDGSFSQVQLPSTLNLQRRRSASTLTPAGSRYVYSWTAGATFYLVDVNGDGIPDLITATLPAKSSVPAPIPSSYNACSSTICNHVYLGDGLAGFSEVATNISSQTIYTDPGLGSNYLAPGHVVDMDGNGLADLQQVGLGSNPKSWISTGDGNFTVIAGYNPLCTLPIDFNGDGRADCVVTNVDVTQNALTSSDGGIGSVPSARFNLIHAGEELKTPTGSSIALEGIVLDIAGDGRGGILRWSDDTTKNKLFLSNGDGSFRVSSSFNFTDTTTNLSGHRLKKSDGSFDFLVGNFTGTGGIEILRLAASPTTASGAGNMLYTKVDATPPDQLTSVTGGTGATTSLYYVPLTSPVPSNGVSGNYGGRYGSDRNTPSAAVSPKVDVTVPMYVVATSVSDSGVGSATVATEYAYFGLKADVNGRGLLGFREVHRQSPGPDPSGTPVTALTQYLQDHPYIGTIVRTNTWLGTVSRVDTLLSSSASAYCDLTAASGADATALSTTQSTGIGVGCPTTAKVQRPYLLWTQESGTDLGGTVLPSVTTRNTFQGSGDPTQIVVTTVGKVAGASQTFTKTTSNQYLADNTAGDAWVLGRLYAASVQSTVPNVLASLTTGAGSSANASAIKGTAPLPPLTAAQLMPILQLLLDD